MIPASLFVLSMRSTAPEKNTSSPGAEYIIEPKTGRKRLDVDEEQRDEIRETMDLNERTLNEAEKAQMKEIGFQIDQKGIKNGDSIVIEIYESRSWARDKNLKTII